MTPDELHEAACHSWRIVCAYDGDDLIGAGRILSDGVFHALIVDVIVLPAFQGRGVGTAIMQALLRECRDSRIHDVQLFCAAGKAPFYRRLGFRERNPEAPGMDYRPG